MTIPQLGTLETVDLRKAFPHEAGSFTPWLAAHLDALAQVIGIPLELEGTEVAVETFSADILARNPQDDTLVLIENQLEVTDHSHLGQIMTYLAGLDAHVVVWIARAFRDAHLSAVRWLNDHTADTFAFFAVQVRVVRIGESPLAPVFEVLARPNAWERQLQAAAQDAQALSSLGQFRKAFWEHYLARYPDEARHGRAGGYSNRWRTIEPLNLVLANYVSVKGVGVYIRGRMGADPQDVYETLTPLAERLRAQTGAAFGTPEGPFFFERSFAADSRDEQRWDELADWLYTTTKTYAAALQQTGE